MVAASLFRARWFYPLSYSRSETESEFCGVQETIDNQAIIIRVVELLDPVRKGRIRIPAQEAEVVHNNERFVLEP